MKTLGNCVTLALAALALSPVMAQQPGHGGVRHGHDGGNHRAEKGEAHERAIALADKDSKASLSSICYAVYQAVKDAPHQADVVFSDVLSQRDNWTPGQVYAIFRAVLMAHPDVNAPLNEHATSHEAETPTGGTGEAAAPEASTDAATVVSGAAEGSTMLSKLVTVLNTATLPAGTADAVVQAAGIQSGRIDANTVESETAEEGDADAGAADAGTTDAGASNVGTPSVGTTDMGASNILVSEMVQTNQEVISGTLGGGTANEEIKEPTPQHPEVVPTPPAVSGQN